MSPGPAQAQTDPLSSYTVTVAAGDVNRNSTVVSFPLPTSPPTNAYHLETPSGETLPLQVGSNEAWFVLNRLPAGTTRTYQIERGAVQTNEITLRRQEKSVEVAVDGSPVLKYWSEARPVPEGLDPIYERGGYLHPVRTPSGGVITGDYSENHAHHHGIWSAWTSTEFRGRRPDFWNMQKGTGAVKTMGLDSIWTGPVQAGLKARHRYVDYTGENPVTALYEGWTLHVYRVPAADSSQNYHLFDLRVEQTAASASPLRLLQYLYGGVAVRGPEDWYGADNSRFLTSAGRDRSNGNETRARWNYFGGTVDGRRAGIAMLSHPDNLRAPQPLRLHPEMPYFTFAPSQLGPFQISPGDPYVAQYRFVTFDGPPNRKVLDRLWTDYAYPPTVTVTKQ